MAEIIEFGTEQGDTILVECSTSNSTIMDASGRDVMRYAEHNFERVLGKVRQVASGVAAELSDPEFRPAEVKVELGVKINAEAAVYIARASGEGSIKVTLTWRTEA
ncbi:CU044_2847 family protein [Lipingzhangella sp. LS1_29]|uniref:CU044_2847 family protein n=1 Tax=Lipingzhangella rawalii TaxID=2055835 RepID=A0ABU2H250_9ACTN|nr:CU044_2847 family protein [Lipingzhangella rawalii]MDS1269371.1 CU044_2847 family protein [Lipingzhangella rawalii]